MGDSGRRDRCGPFSLGVVGVDVTACLLFGGEVVLVLCRFVNGDVGLVVCLLVGGDVGLLVGGDLVLVLYLLDGLAGLGLPILGEGGLL